MSDEGGSDSDFERQRLSFDAAAEVYERARPSYPDAAVDWLLPPGARRVLDLGAGTGKLTRALVDRGLEVTAVDPSERMLRQLSAALPAVEVRIGAAEALPLSPGELDAVLVAQAWHWVDPAAATPEVARVLRPGGTLGLIWNIRDDTVPWVAALTEAMGSSAAETAMQSEVTIGEPFGPTERAAFGWARPMTVDGLVELAASRSYVISATAEQREAVLAAVRDLALTHPDLAGRESFDLPYTTHVFRAARPR